MNDRFYIIIIMINKTRK